MAQRKTGRKEFPIGRDVSDCGLRGGGVGSLGGERRGGCVPTTLFTTTYLSTTLPTMHFHCYPHNSFSPAAS